MPTEDVIAHRS